MIVSTDLNRGVVVTGSLSDLHKNAKRYPHRKVERAWNNGNGTWTAVYVTNRADAGPFIYLRK